jgi:DNA transformation protein
MKKKADGFRDYVVEQLGGEASFRAMFGGYGIYLGGRIIGIVHKARLYFTTGPLTRPEYVQRGMKAFKPNARQTLKSYYEVPAEVLEHAETLRTWALKAASR